MTGKTSTLAAISLTGLLGCGMVNDRINPEVPLWFHRPSNAMHVSVRKPLTAPPRQEGEAYERGRPEVDPKHGRVFVGSADRGLYALRAYDGSAIWRFETLGVVQSEPLYEPTSQVVFFGAHDGALYAVKADDGRLLWRFSTSSEVVRKPVIAGDLVIFANGADQLFAVERATGKLRWQARRNPALGMEISGYAGPTFDRGKVYMAYSDGHVVAYDAATGGERWTPVDLGADAEQTAGISEAPRYLDVDTTPVVGDINPGGHVVFVASYAGGVFALDAETGTRVWSNSLATGVTDLVLWSEGAHFPNAFGPDPDGPELRERSILLASSGGSGLWALDPNTGHEIWRNKIPEGGISSPVPIAGAILVATTRYGLFLVSPRDGKVIDGFDVGTGFAQTPGVYGHRAFIMSNSGVFFGIHVEPPIVMPSTARYWNGRAGSFY